LQDLKNVLKGRYSQPTQHETTEKKTRNRDEGLDPDPERRARLMSSKLLSRSEGEPPLQIPAGEAQAGDWLEIVQRQVGRLRFGSVSITVHEGRVVQVETSAKVRFEKGH
jgi:hypothetical protein